MAITTKIYTISLSSLSISGVDCRNIDLEFEKPDCSNVVCEYKDGKIKLSVPETCIGECVYANVSCKDGLCPHCPSSERIKICPCTSPEDCGDCETCTDNLCVSVCDPDQFCENDRCVDCNNQNPCPQNQICVEGNCQCPPDKPFLDDKGRCRSCLESGDCGPCEICTPEGCRPIDCVEGVCDPETDSCVECVKTGDCLGDNECCVDKVCECCPGFVRDVVSGNCIPAPECEIDDDCDECEICTPEGCRPIVCPEGQICDGGICVDDPTDPCDKPCGDGTDCDPGCGCDQETERCTSCENLDCEECARALGCICTDGENCVYNDKCNNDPCANAFDCDEGCTCDEGVCVPCESLTCPECDGYEGCRCTNEGDCVGDDKDCSDTFELNLLDENCDLEAELIKNGSCSCAQLTLVAKLTNILPNPSGFALSYSAEVRKFGATEFVDINDENAHPLLSNESHPNIADNEEPLSGTVRLTARYLITVQDVYPDGSIRNIRIRETSPFFDSSISLSGSATNFTSVNDFPTFITLDVGDIFNETAGSAFTTQEIVTEVIVDFYQDSNFTFPNSCGYDSQTTPIDTFVWRGSDDLESVMTSADANAYTLFGVTSTDDERDPLFVWSRDDNGQFTEDSIFRKQYISETNGSFVDTLYGPDHIPESGNLSALLSNGELLSGTQYFVTNDCSCADGVDIYSIFCSPLTEITDNSFNFSDCQTKLVDLQLDTPCDVNQDLRQWSIDGQAIAERYQVKFELYLNGIQVDLIQHVSGVGMVSQEYSVGSRIDTIEYEIGNNVVITSVRFEHIHDKDNKCRREFTYPDPSDLELDVIYGDCTEKEFEITLVPTRPVDTISFELIDSNGITDLGGGRFRVTKGIASITVRVSYSYNGSGGLCIKDFTLPLNPDCDCDVSFDALSKTAQIGDTVVFNYTLEGISKPYTFGVSNSNLGGTSNSNLGSLRFTNVQQSSTHTVTFTDNLGCELERVINIVVQEAPEFELTGSSVCSGETGTVEFFAGSDFANGTVTYSINGGSNITSPLDVNGRLILTGISSSSTYNFITATTSDNNSFSVGLSADVTVTNQVDASFVGNMTTICQGSSYEIEVTGTPNTVVTVSNIGTITLDGSGNGSSIVTPTSSTNYVLTRVELGDCFEQFSQSFTVNVAPPVDFSVVSAECASQSVNSDFAISFTEQPTSATDQSGTDISSLIVGTTVVIPSTSTVAVVNAVFDNGVCQATASATRTSCTCPVNFIVDTTVEDFCDGSDGSITINSFSIEGDSVTDFTATWNDGGVPQIGSIYTTSSAQSQVILTLTVNSGNYQDCTYTQNYTIQEFDIDGAGTIIETNPSGPLRSFIGINDSVTYTIPQSNLNAIEWGTEINGMIYNVLNGADIDYVFTPNDTPTYPGIEGTYEIYAVYENPTGCRGVTRITVEVQDNPCDSIVLPIDGTFETCSNPSTESGTINSALNNNPTCTGFLPLAGTTCDLFLPPLTPGMFQGSTLLGMAEGMVSSPDGGIFAAGGAWNNREGFETNINVTQGLTYEVSFYQANAGGNPDVTAIGDPIAWDVTFDNQTQRSPERTFEGFGSQTWTLVTMSFISNTTGFVPLRFRNAGALTSKNASAYYAAIDGIEVKENC